jgi:hypothetical protein
MALLSIRVDIRVVRVTVFPAQTTVLVPLLWSKAEVEVALMTSLVESAFMRNSVLYSVFPEQPDMVIQIACPTDVGDAPSFGLTPSKSSNLKPFVESVLTAFEADPSPTKKSISLSPVFAAPVFKQKAPFTVEHVEPELADEILSVSEFEPPPTTPRFSTRDGECVTREKREAYM